MTLLASANQDPLFNFFCYKSVFFRCLKITIPIYYYTCVDCQILEFFLTMDRQMEFFFLLWIFCRQMECFLLVWIFYRKMELLLFFFTMDSPLTKVFWQVNWCITPLPLCMEAYKVLYLENALWMGSRQELNHTGLTLFK